MEQIEKKTTIEYKYWEINNQFQTSSNLKKVISQSRDFYNGKQWGDVKDDSTPRIVLNLCSFSANLKSAKIVGTSRYRTFTSDNGYDCTALQRFDDYNIHKLNEDTEDFTACLRANVDGTAVSYMRWDEDDTSYKGIYKGGLVEEQLDVLKYCVANPHKDTTQGQKWVMFWNSFEVGAVRELVERENKEDAERVKASILPDDYEEQTNGENREDISHRMVTVFTRFFRIDGEVYFMMSTKNAYLFEYPHAMSPLINIHASGSKVKKLVADYKKKLLEDGIKSGNFDKNLSRVDDLDIDYEDMTNQVVHASKIDDEEYKSIKEKFSLYPFADLKLQKVINSYWGNSDIRQLISSQVGVNYALSMLILTIQNNAWGKYLVKDGALNGQEITNEPGQVITDYSEFTNSWGVKILESQPMPNGVTEFVNTFIGYLRVFYGFNDVMDGSVSNQDLSGYAVQQMIKQANTSIEQQQKLFWEYCKQKTAIRLMFYKFFVDKAKYTYERDDSDLEKQEQARMKLYYANEMAKANGQHLDIDPNGTMDFSTPTPKIEVREITGEELYGVNFDINIDVIQGLVDSELQEAQIWDTLIMNGGIQNLSPEMLEMYLACNPTITQRTKDQLKSIVEKQKKEENTQLRQQNEQMQAQLEQAVAIIQQMQAQNGYLQEYTKNLTKEFGNKINVANKVIGNQNKQLETLSNATQKESQGEVKSNNARGISGTKVSNYQE